MENNKSLELIKAEIERLKKILKESTYYLDNSQQALGYSFALDDFKELLDSLPEEKPSEDLEEEIEMQWDSFNKHLADYDGESEDVVWLNWLSFVDIARYFYELGKQEAK